MPTVPLPQRPHLDQLRKQARDLRRAVRAGDPEALRLIAEHHPRPPVDFPLSAAQLVLARQYGFAGWARLKRHVEVLAQRTWIVPEQQPDEDAAARFVRLACLNFDHDDPGRWAEAARLLAAHPDLPGRDLATAAAAADPDAVAGFLTAEPAAANRQCGPYRWSPLLYLAYSRQVPGQDAVLATARLLLRAGADPDDGRFFLGLPTPFTVLTGIFGGGEADQPPHPHAGPFARLVLQAGADPNDGQALYNRMFRAADDHLELLFEFGLGRGDGGPWHRLLGPALESPGQMLRRLLFWAVTHDQRDRVRLLARHGVDLSARLDEPRGWGATGSTPVELASLAGHRELADLLIGLGAGPAVLDPAGRFLDAALAGDAEGVRRTPRPVVEAVRRSRPGLVVWAAGLGRLEAIETLVSLGFDVNALGRGDTIADDRWQTALHQAAGDGDVALVRRLLELGADPSIQDRRFGATALDWARHLGHQAVVDVLSPGSS